jgi:hypothetical protein
VSDNEISNDFRVVFYSPDWAEPFRWGPISIRNRRRARRARRERTSQMQQESDNEVHFGMQVDKN